MEMYSCMVDLASRQFPQEQRLEERRGTVHRIGYREGCYNRPPDVPCGQSHAAKIAKGLSGRMQC
jgi:hypothetical protein